MGKSQDNQERGILNFPFLGMVVNDKEEHSWEIEVYPMEVMPDYTGDLDAPSDVKTQTVDAFGNNLDVQVKKDRKIKCKWLPLFDTANRVTPPSVRAGETVVVVNFASLDKYFWVNGMYADADLRKLENRIIHLSNKQKGGDATLEQGYYTAMDTYNKFIKLHTSNNDGEYTTYDLEFRTKDGVVKLWDGKNNYIELDSQNDRLTVNTNNEVIVNATNFVQVNTIDTENNSSNSVTINADNTFTVNTKVATINADDSCTVNTKTATINADDSTTVNTNTATVNADSSATIKTQMCTIDSTMCQIN